MCKLTGLGLLDVVLYHNGTVVALTMSVCAGRFDTGAEGGLSISPVIRKEQSELGSSLVCACSSSASV